MKPRPVTPFVAAVSFLALLMSAASFAAAKTAVLWQDPGPIAAKDLFWGSGSPDRAPQSPFVFVDEDTSGTKPKVRIKDARGTLWNVKFRVNDAQGDEVQAEVAASRIAWALGYFVEESYYVASGRIMNLPKLRRGSPHLESSGEFRGARFEMRSPAIERNEIPWSFSANPFSNTREFSGLKVLMALLGNWDNHDSNNKIFQVALPDGRRQERYVVADWGSSFGRMDNPGFFTNRSRWHKKDYQDQKFIDGVSGNELLLHYKGAEPTIKAVPLDDARWFSRLASALTREQVRQAFAAAGATSKEIDGFSERLLERIGELRAAIGSPRESRQALQGSRHDG